MGYNVSHGNPVGGVLRPLGSPGWIYLGFRPILQGLRPYASAQWARSAAMSARSAAMSARLAGRPPQPRRQGEVRLAPLLGEIDRQGGGGNCRGRRCRGSRLRIESERLGCSSVAVVESPRPGRSIACTNRRLARAYPVGQKLSHGPRPARQRARVGPPGALTRYEFVPRRTWRRLRRCRRGNSLPASHLLSQFGDVAGPNL